MPWRHNRIDIVNPTGPAPVTTTGISSVGFLLSEFIGAPPFASTCPEPCCSRTMIRERPVLYLTGWNSEPSNTRLVSIFIPPRACWSGYYIDHPAAQLQLAIAPA